MMATAASDDSGPHAAQGKTAIRQTPREAQEAAELCAQPQPQAEPDTSDPTPSSASVEAAAAAGRASSASVAAAAAAGRASSASMEAAAAAGRASRVSGEGDALPTPATFAFPFEPYGIQKRFMSSLFEAIERGGLGLFESPTGTVCIGSCDICVCICVRICFCLASGVVQSPFHGINFPHSPPKPHRTPPHPQGKSLSLLCGAMTWLREDALREERRIKDIAEGRVLPPVLEESTSAVSDGSLESRRRPI
jgi:hypothetical protein